MLLDGKARQPVEGINGGEVKLPFSCKSELSLRTLEANHLTIINARIKPIVILTLNIIPHTLNKLVGFPFNFKPLHFSHSFSWSTVYSSGSLSNLEPGMLSSSVRALEY